MISDRNILLKNVCYLSSLARFNSERVTDIMRFYDFAFTNGFIFKGIIDLEDVVKFIRTRRESEKDLKDIGSRRKSLIGDEILTLHGSSNPNLDFPYVSDRYGHLSLLLFKEAGFSLRALVSVENIIGALIHHRANQVRLLNKVYVFKSEDEYRDFSMIAEPSKQFKRQWSSCVNVWEADVLCTYVQNCVASDHMDEVLSSSINRINPKNKKLTDFRFLEGWNVLQFLTKDLNQKNQEFGFLLKPLIRYEKKADGKTYYIAPFPRILGTTIQVRIENLIQGSVELSKADEETKGKLVERIGGEVLTRLPNRNIIRNFKYKIGEHQFETDILLLLEDSIWAVEIKSHPIFRRIPSEFEKLIPSFVAKAVEGVNQGRRTLDWISKNTDLMYSLNCRKNPNEMTKGVIVLLDGLLPTFFTQNEFVDCQIHGIDLLYEYIKEPVRTYLLTILELETLTMQYDSDNFESFLLWRTKYFGKMPIIAFDEKEYWAYFNNPEHDEETKFLDERIEKGSLVLVNYISSRFTSKDYLKRINKSSVTKGPSQQRSDQRE